MLMSERRFRLRILVQLSDFFEFEVCKNAQVAAEPIADATPGKPKRKARQVRRFENSTEGKVSRDK
jgi:hypothetical protein